MESLSGIGNAREAARAGDVKALQLSLIVECTQILLRADEPIISEIDWYRCRFSPVFISASTVVPGLQAVLLFLHTEAWPGYSAECISTLRAFRKEWNVRVTILLIHSAISIDALSPNRSSRMDGRCPWLPQTGNNVECVSYGKPTADTSSLRCSG